MSMKVSKSRAVGNQGEKEAAEIMGNAVYLGHHSIADFNWNGKFIEVKTATLNTNGWTFNLCKQRGRVDYFLMICKSSCGLTQHILFIPGEILLRNNLVLSKRILPLYEKYALGGTVR